MSTRAKIASAVASVGVLALGWQVGTTHGQTTAPAQPSTTTTTTGSSPSSSGTKTSSGSSTTASGTTTAPSAGAGASALKDGSYTGTASTNRFGSVQVTILVSGGAITTVNATANASDSKSRQINSRAIPVLKSETLAAQSADISTVSGATYTSESYLTSLQSALDQAAA